MDDQEQKNKNDSFLKKTSAQAKDKLKDETKKQVKKKVISIIIAHLLPILLITISVTMVAVIVICRNIICNRQMGIKKYK